MNNLNALSDEQLVCDFRGGNSKAVEQLLVRYKNRVLSIARSFFLAGGDTEDLVQEGMCGLYSAIVSFKGQSGFFPYACACIKNRMLDAVKRSGNSKNIALSCFVPITEEDAVLSEDASPEEALIYSENVGEFSAALKKCLSKLEYKAITKYIDGFPMAEISCSLGITYKQAENAVARAKGKLKKLLQNKQGKG